MNFSRLLILVLLGKILSSECKNVNSYSKRRIPYQVSVEVDSDFKCTGAIINVYWVAAVSSCLQNASANKVIVRAATRAPLWRGSAHRVQQLVTSPPCSSGHLILLKVFNKFKFNGKTRPVTMLPRTPSSGDIGWESTWPCIQVPYNTISQRPITILEPSFCKEITTDPENVCVFGKHRLWTNPSFCQNTGALVVVQDRLAGFVLRSYNSTVDICLQIIPYIPWIVQIVFGGH